MFGAENHEDHNQEAAPQPQTRTPLIWIGSAAALIAIAGLLALVSSHHQQATVAQLTSQEGAMTSKIASLQDQLTATQDQLSAATQKLNEVTAEQAAAQAQAPTQAQAKTQAAQQTAQAKKSSTAKRVAARRPVVDPRWKQMQDRLDAQQKQLDANADAINQTRSDLTGTIGSTRDELNGSIAKNHEELVALEQRGERNYYEFDLSKSKGFQKAGPISVSLRKTDAKHDHYDVALMVDDNEIQKKNVDLYEPIVLRDSDDPQPVEIVVNKIDKNHIHGYVSASKYTQAQLTPAAASTNAPASQTPATTTVPATQVGNPQSN